MSFFARLFAIVRPRRPQRSLDAGIVALEGRRFEDALAHFRRALDEASSDMERALVHNKRGIAHLRSGDRDAAIDAFVDALGADARCVPVIVNIGNLLFEDGNFAEAIAHYEAALRIDDAYPAAHLNLGVAFRKVGRRADAVRELRRADRLEARFRKRRN